MVRNVFALVLIFIFFAAPSGVCGSEAIYKIWVPYVESPPIVFDGYIDSLAGEWDGSARYDISDLRGSMGEPLVDSGSAFLYVSHDESRLSLAIVNRADSVLSVGDIVTLWVDDNNNDTLDVAEEGHYELRFYPGGDSLIFFGHLVELIVTDFDIGIGESAGYVCVEAVIRLGAVSYELACETGESFGAWIAVKDVGTQNHTGVWPPTWNYTYPEYYGDMYLATDIEFPPPRPPDNVTVCVNRPDTVLIEWDKPKYDVAGDSLEGLELIRIYRNGVQLDSVSTAAPGVHMSYEDTKAQLGRSYSYRLSAVDSKRGESSLTEPENALPGYVRYFSDFEADSGGWAPTVTRTWMWGEPLNYRPEQAHSGINCWATNPNGLYPENVRWLLTSPHISIEDLAVTRSAFRMYHSYETEVGFDGGNVKISTDGGGSWFIQEPEGGYPVGSIVGLDNEPGFSGSSGGWTYASFDLSDYVGETVEIRFDFGSDGSTEFPGWYVDDVLVVVNSPGVGVEEVRNPGRANGKGPMLAVSPNPSHGRTTIAYQLSQQERIGLYVYDLAGRRIATLYNGNQKGGTHSSFWDGTDGSGASVSSGVYICRLNIGASFKAEKLLIIK